MRIDKKDVIWSYLAAFLKISSSALLLPIILKKLPPETVGIWAIFMTISSLSALLDFGFGPSFSRNVSYVFSGVRALKVNGFDVIDNNLEVDFRLLKGLIAAMKWFYLRMSLILCLLLLTAGTFYITFLLKSYSGDHREVFISWFMLCLISTYNLFTLYYDSLLQGKGLIKKSKQIVVIGQIIYLSIASFLILRGHGLVAIVSAQVSSVIIVRWLSYKAFFTQAILESLKGAASIERSFILRAISPNAIKIGLTSIGGFAVQKSSIIIGSLFLSLPDIASYGITMQLISVMSGLGTIYLSTYLPLVARSRVINDTALISSVFLKSQIILILLYLFGGSVLVFFGHNCLAMLKSTTQLLPVSLMIIGILGSLLESNHSIAGAILLSKNEVPFFKASLLSGLFAIILLLLMIIPLQIGLWSLVLAPAIAQAVYQNWKWPLVVYKDLNISGADFVKSLKFIKRNIPGTSG
jgi:O-antigen/teichoic acid export membrane protein